MATARRLAFAVPLLMIGFAAQAQGRADLGRHYDDRYDYAPAYLSGVINFECARPQGIKWIISIDLGGKLVRYMDVDDKGEGFGWQGPTRARIAGYHRISWFSMVDPRVRWVFDRAKGALEIDVAAGQGRRTRPPSIKLQCVELLPEYVKP